MQTLKSKTVNWLYISLFVAVAVLATTATAQAAPSANIDYTVTEKNRVRVQADYNLSGNPGELVITAPTTNISAVDIKFSNGKKLPYTTTETEVSAGGQKFMVKAFKLDFSRWHQRRLPSQGVRVSYVAGGLVRVAGGARVLKIPAIGAQISGLSGLATVRVPADYPQLHAAGGALEYGTVGKRRFFTFQLNKLADDAIRLSFGKVGHWRLRLHGPLSGGFSGGYTTWHLPPDLSYQTVALESITPSFDRSRLDVHGNWLVQYLQPPLQKQTVDSTVLVSVKQLNYRLGQAGNPEDIPDPLNHYTRATSFWPRGEVAATVQDKVGDSESLVERIRKTYNFLSQRYQVGGEPLDFDGVQPVPQTLDSEGEISQLAFYDLLVTSLRAQDIPARQIVGLVPTKSGGSGPPVVWAEAFVPEVGWLMLDKSVIDQFGGLKYTLADHLGLWVVGDKTTRSQASSLVNRLGQSEVELSAAKPEETKAKSELSLSGHRYFLLPGLSLDISSITAQSQRVIGGVELKTDHYSQFLGAFAPQENKKIAQFVFGPTSWQAGQAMATGQGIEASASLPLNWWLLVGTILVVLAGYFVIRWTRSSATPIHSQNGDSQSPVQAAEDINLLPDALREQPKVDHHEINPGDDG